MGVITLSISARTNQPPSSSGWLSIPLDYDSTHVFTLANFTTETTPAYSDPEDDALESIKITSLPVHGQLLKGVIPGTLNDVTTSAELKAGDLTYVSEDTVTEGQYDGLMDFIVSDVG